jgi:dipeptidyl aminopeptidase/acylaminoacyl peptidase
MAIQKVFGWIVVTVLSLLAAPAIAGDEAPTPTVEVGRWLALGPLKAPLPAFDEGEETAMLKGLLDEEMLQVGLQLPVNGEGVEWVGGEAKWRIIDADREGAVSLTRPAGVASETGAIAWLTTSIVASRFVEVKLQIESQHPVAGTFDGAKLEMKEGADIGLEPGSHTLTIKTVFDPGVEGPWSVSTTISGDHADTVRVTVAGERDLGILDVLDATTVTAFDLSPDGSRLLLVLTRVRPGTDDRETWVELRATGDGELLHSWRGAPAMSEPRFAPTGDRISYVTSDADEETSSLWVSDLSSGETREVIEGVKNWRSYSWSPTGETVVYASAEEPEKDDRGIKHLRGLLDRMADHRTISSLYLVRVADRTMRRLTTGPVSTSAGAFSPDGSRLLVAREVEDLSRRPYSRTELWELDLVDGGARKLRDGWWLYQAEYAPDGRRLLIRGGPSEFGTAGIAEGLDQTVNDFDGQLFVWDPASDAVDAITRSFDPAVVEARWSRHDGAIYFLTVDREYRNIYRFSPEDGEITVLSTGIESVDDFDLADDNATLVAAGSSVWKPHRVVVLDGPAASPRLLVDPAAERFRRIRKAEVESWSFTATDGRVVAGHVYLPVGFDREKSYPAIVNYYGGTSPINRSFGGRYPAEWWAANGYVVYVLTPTGAYGWGQEESTIHVNDWGEITGRQIIEATGAFLKAHPFVDPNRVGCIGASYGGFMTMGLVTKTDLYAAAVAHAGISALSSYWGEGYWGYSYGAVANADSFPWNRQDLFVDRSPLFAADKVTTPVLLTHGMEDPNVPPGESDQFFAALRLLGVPTEYLRIAGLGHLIMEHDKRVLWSKSIVAWFDRWLKDEPEWWESLWPAQ